MPRTGAALSFPTPPPRMIRQSPGRRRTQKIREHVIQGLLFGCSALSILTTAGIVAVLIFETIEFFREQGVAVKVISGDNPLTVGAIAGEVGVAGADHPIDARQLPEDLDALAAVLAGASVFGRVQPHQKRAMVRALQAAGHTVAMTGDGVNDVLALKDADMGVAMGSGSGATRSVAQLVLLDDSFASLPQVVAEGRKVIANVERVANLFVTKSVYAAVLAFAVGAQQAAGEEPAQQLLALLGGEAGLLGVAHELQRPEEARAADVADDRHA